MQSNIITSPPKLKPSITKEKKRGMGRQPHLEKRTNVSYFYKKYDELAGKPIPKPSYLDECIPIGAVNGQRRWKSKDGKRLFTWDSLHGEIEVFNDRGRHLAVYSPDGTIIKGAVKGRKIDV